MRALENRYSDTANTAGHQGANSLLKTFNVAIKAKQKIFVIIDEYDHFANDLIAMGNRSGTNFYKTMVAANGMVRDFYETVKAATKNSVADRTFITGISPVMLGDLTSGYNIATILTLDPAYNEMMGFTQEEVNLLMTVTGVAPALITIDMEGYYNGYLFLSKVYVPMSEYEAMSGRADIFLQRNPNLPQVKYEWVFELKYCKTSATDREIAAKCDKGLVQLKQYAQSRCLGERPDLKAAVLVFTGKNQYLIETI